MNNIKPSKILLLLAEPNRPLNEKDSTASKSGAFVDMAVTAYAICIDYEEEQATDKLLQEYSKLTATGPLRGRKCAGAIPALGSHINYKS